MSIENQTNQKLSYQTVTEAIDKETALLELFKTKGWQEVRNFIEIETISATKRLIEETDHTKMLKLQAEIKALDTIPRAIFGIMESADRARAILQEPTYEKE